MNIFASSEDPEISARYLDDARVVKMCLESAQMLMTGIVVRSGSNAASEFYGLKPTHANHPCNVWVRGSRANWEWLYDHMVGLANEHQRRSGHGRRHATVAKLESMNFHRSRRVIPLGPRTSHANCARHGGLGVDYSWVPDVHKAYQLYLNHRWQLQIELAAESRQKAVWCSLGGRFDSKIVQK